MCREAQGSKKPLGSAKAGPMAEVRPGVWYPNTRTNLSKFPRQTFCWLWRGKARDFQGRAVEPYMEVGFKSPDGDSSPASPWVINGELIRAPSEVSHFMAAELPAPPGGFTLHDHAYWLGKLIANLHSLEFSLRAFLTNAQERERYANSPTLSELIDARAGQAVALSPLTDFDDLGRLIDRYNAQVQRVATELVINGQRVVDLRNALAHGRVLAIDLEHPFPLPLIKFSKPETRKSVDVKVVWTEKLTADWFAAQTSLIAGEIQTVSNASGKFCP